MIKKILVLAAFLVITAVTGFVGIAQANPIQYPTGTTTTAFLATSASTTLVMDAYYLGGNNRANEGATLLLQDNPSAAGSVLTILFEYSQDGISYYGDTLNVSTTTVSNLNSTKSYTLTPGVTASTSRAIYIETPTRFTRAVFTSTVASSTIYAQFVPKKQIIE